MQKAHSRVAENSKNHFNFISYLRSHREFGLRTIITGGFA